MLNIDFLLCHIVSIFRFNNFKLINIYFGTLFDYKQVICNNAGKLLLKNMNEEFNVTLSGIRNETINDVKLAIRYGYSYRKIAQAQYNKTSKLNYCLPETSDILIWLGAQILSGITWDSIKAIAKSIYNNYKNCNKFEDIDKETEYILSDEKELLKFDEYIKEFNTGLVNIPEKEYKYIEEEMMADFCSEMETEIYIKEKRMVTIEERIQIRKTARIKIKKITQREDNIK